MAALFGHATGAAQGNAQDATRKLIPTEKGGIELTKPKLASEDPQPLLKLDVGIQPSTDSSFQQPYTYRAHAEAQPGQTGKAAFNAATWELGLSSDQFAAGQAVTIGNVLRFTQAGLNGGETYRIEFRDFLGQSGQFRHAVFCREADLPKRELQAMGVRRQGI